jgi:hypothetical protein
VTGGWLGVAVADGLLTARLTAILLPPVTAAANPEIIFMLFGDGGVSYFTSSVFRSANRPMELDTLLLLGIEIADALVRP